MKLIFWIMAFVFAASGTANASPCPQAGSVNAKALNFYTNDFTVILGLRASADLGLTPPSFPDTQISENTSPCIRASFKANGEDWTLFGDDDHEPTRWARSPSEPGRTIFLADMPLPEQAYQWALQQQKTHSQEPVVHFKSMMFTVVIAEGAHRKIYGFFDDIPDDARVVATMRDVLEARAPRLINYDVRTFDASRIYAPLTLAVMLSQGHVAPEDQPDSPTQAFSVQADHTAKATASGLVCPATITGYSRSSLFTTGGASGSVESGCRYLSGYSRMAIVTTHLPPAVNAQDAIATMLRPFSAMGTEHLGPAMPMTGNMPSGVITKRFDTSDGARVAVWSFTRGEWAFEVYALYAPADEASANASASLMLSANAQAN